MNASEEPRGSSRVEREILEILERSEASQSPVDQLQTAMRRQRASARTQLSRKSSEGWTFARLPMDIFRIAGAFLLAIAAAALSDVSHLVAVILAIASAAVFFSLWVPARPSTPGGPPRWRGRDLHDDGPPFGGPRSPRR